MVIWKFKNYLSTSIRCCTFVIQGKKLNLDVDYGNKYFKINYQCAQREEIRFKSEWNGQIFEQWGTIVEFDPYEKLKYTLFAPRPDLEDKPENYFEMEYKLINNKNGTELTITQEDNRPGAKQEPEQGEENPVLKVPKDLIEKDA